MATNNWQEARTSELLRAAASVLSIDLTPSGVAFRDELRVRATLLEQEAHSTRNPDGTCDVVDCDVCKVLKSIGEIQP